MDIARIVAKKLGKKLGIQVGTMAHFMLKTMDWGFEGFPNAAVKIFSNGALAIIAMKNHQVDIVIDGMPAFEITKAYSDTKIANIALTNEKYAIGIVPHNVALKILLMLLKNKLSNMGRF